MKAFVDSAQRGVLVLSIIKGYVNQGGADVYRIGVARLLTVHLRTNMLSTLIIAVYGRARK